MLLLVFTIPTRLAIVILVACITFVFLIASYIVNRKRKKFYESSLGEPLNSEDVKFIDEQSSVPQLIAREEEIAKEVEEEKLFKEKFAIQPEPKQESPIIEPIEDNNSVTSLNAGLQTSNVTPIIVGTAGEFQPDENTAKVFSEPESYAKKEEGLTPEEQKIVDEYYKGMEDSKA